MTRWLFRSSAAVFGFYFLGVLVGLVRMRRGTAADKLAGERLLEYRLMAFGRFPLRQVGMAIVEGNVPKTAALMGVVNLSAAALHYAAGLLYLSPLLAAGQGFMLGAMLAVRGSLRTHLFSLLVLPFEVGAFAISGGLGMERATRWWHSMRGTPGEIRERSSLRWGLPAVLLLQATGGVLEALGAIHFRLPGVLTLEEIERAVRSGLPR